jgi:hypothetical protein
MDNRERPVVLPLTALSTGELGVAGTIRERVCAVVIDTGFNGFVAAPEVLLRALGHDTVASEAVTTEPIRGC